jgi:formamidopyrimidine-DNA glycosylase
MVKIRQIPFPFCAFRNPDSHWIECLNFPTSPPTSRPSKPASSASRFSQPCPRCGSPIQRIRYADNETNYCAHCHTGGKVLADRSLSRLLGSDWPRTLDELEALKRR